MWSIIKMQHHVCSISRKKPRELYLEEQCSMKKIMEKYVSIILVWILKNIFIIKNNEYKVQFLNLSHLILIIRWSHGL